MGQVKGLRIRRPYIVDSRPTGRLGLALLLVMVALGSWGYLALDFTQNQPHTNLDAIPNGLPIGFRAPAPEREQPPDLEQLKRNRDALEDETAELEQQLHRLTKDRQIENTAVQESQDKIQALQTENAQLRTQIAFLTQLFGGDDGPIDISDLALSRKDESTFRYWFKVSRTIAGDNMLNGQVRMQIRGKLDGEERFFSLSELTNNDRDEHRLGFRNFQEIDGELKLPQDFVPEELLVVVVPEDKSTGGARRQFKWQISQDGDEQQSDE